MPKVKLEKELQTGIAKFIAYGKASISSDTFPENTKESQSGYVYKRVAFPVKIGDTNSIYVQMMGGYSKKKPVIYVFNKDTNANMEIDWDLRDNEEVLKNVADFSYINVALEKDDKGKLIRKQFLSELDAIDYMSKHLNDGDDIYVSGNIEYQRYNGKISRSFNITSIGLTEKEHALEAEMRQTYLLESTALPRDWEKQLRENHEITVNAFVPQYIGKENGKEIKKILAFPQQFAFQATDDNIENMIKVVERFLKVKKGVVRELALRNEIIHGYEKVKGEIKRNPEVMELIELGIMTEEQLEQEETIGNRSVDKVIFKRPMTIVKDDVTKINMADKYAPEALVVVEDDEDIEEGTSVFEEDNKDDSADASDTEEDVFGGLFND